MGESTPQTSENAGIGTVEEVPYMGDTTALRTTCSECEYGGVTKHLSRRQAEKALTEHYAVKHSSPTERDGCGGCLCPTEHDGDYGSSGHPGPCPPHTCGLSVPTETAQTPPLTGFSVSESPLCHHCGHVRGLHGRNHGCISAFADGEAGKPCACPGFVRYPPEQKTRDSE